MQRFDLLYGSSTFSYLKGGTGKKILICLHGFGEEAATFAFLEPYLEKEFTLYAIDFPWHGKTDGHHTLTFTYKELLGLLQEMIPDFKTKTITLLGYSMGGRVALSLAEQIPEKIKKLVLLAPDGFTIHFWYWLATQTAAGNRIFKYTMQDPRWFKWMVDGATRLKWIHQRIASYAHSFIDTPETRTDLYNIWTTMRMFRPHLSSVKQKILANNTPVYLVFGEFDRMILPKSGFLFQKGAETCVKVHVLKSGHQLLKEKNADFIVSLLNDE